MNSSDKGFTLWWLAALLVSILIALYTPPFAMPDEGAHFLRATEVSQFHLVNNKGNVGVEMACQDYLIAAKKYAPIAYFQAVDSRADVNQPSCKVKTINSAGMYSPIPYLASASGLFLASKTGWSVESRLKVARVFNALSTSFICLLVLFPLRRWRAQLSLIALLPMTIWLRSSISADAMTITLCIAFLCYTVNLMEKQKAIGLREILALCGIAALLGSMKPAYGILGFASLALYPCIQTFSSRAKWPALLAPGICALVASVFWAKLADPALIYLGNGANPGAQLVFILQHPLQYMHIIVGTLKHALGDLTYNGMIPSLAAAQQFSLPFGVASCVLLLIATLALTASSDNVLQPVQRVILVLTPMVCLAAITSPLYLTYTPVGHDRILGLQGRYFLPVVLCLLLPAAFQRSQSFFISTALRTNLGVGLPVVINAMALALFFIKKATG